jgi:hypothetical protein
LIYGKLSWGQRYIDGLSNFLIRGWTNCPSSGRP